MSNGKLCVRAQPHTPTTTVATSHPCDVSPDASVDNPAAQTQPVDLAGNSNASSLPSATSSARGQLRLLALASARYLCTAPLDIPQAASNTFIAEVCFVLERRASISFFIGILMASMPLPH